MGGDEERLRRHGQAAGHPPGFRQGQPLRLPAMRHCRLSDLRQRGQDLAAPELFSARSLPTCAGVAGHLQGVRDQAGISPLARSDSGFTLLFEALVMAMVQAMPVAVVARMVDEWDTRLWRVIHHYVEAARDRADHSEVTSVALDEMASRRGHNYVSLFVDLVCRRVLFVAEGKDAGTVDAFAKSLPSRKRGIWRPMAAIPRPSPRCIDMSPAFIPTGHVWMAPGSQGFFHVSASKTNCSHVYGLEARRKTAGPDGFRGSRSDQARGVALPHDP